MANKIKYGLKNVHVAKVTETLAENGAWETSYGAFQKWAGAVSIELSNEGEISNFYADDSIYAMVASPNTYSGTLESARIPEFVELNVYNNVKDAETGLVTEKIDDKTSYIAIAFEIDGDVSKRRYVFYRAMLSRSTVSAKTTEDTKTPQTDSVSINISGRPDDGLVKAFADEGTSAFTNFFTEVQLPTPANAEG